MRSYIDVAGAKGSSGREYVIIGNRTASVCIPRDLFMTDIKEAKARLARARVLVLKSSDWSTLVDQVAQAEISGMHTIIEKVGWNAGSFALPDGTLFPERAGEERHLAFEPQLKACATSGSLNAWRKQVAAQLTGQDLATFVVCAMFAAPLLSLTVRSDNFGFEIVGGKGTGKSTLQHIAASVLGGVVRGEAGHYWSTLDTTVNALEDTMRGHADLPIILDEANLLGAGATPRQRSDIFSALAFKLGTGSIKNRFGSGEGEDFRCTYVISSNENLAVVLGQTGEVARAAADRLITLQLHSSRPYGVYDTLPKAFGSASEFGEALLHAASQNHGHAFRRYLKCLVKAKAENEAELRKTIQDRLHAFRRMVRVDGNSGSAVRVADAFGLVFVAGKLCQDYGVLPRAIKVKRAARQCHAMHLRSGANSNQDLAARLQAFWFDPRVKLIKKGSEVGQRPLAYIRKRDDRAELLIPPENLLEIFPDWKTLKKGKEFEEWAVRDDDHSTVKRRIVRNGKSLRLYCFNMPRRPASTPTSNE